MSNCYFLPSDTSIDSSHLSIGLILTNRRGQERRFAMFPMPYSVSSRGSVADYEQG